MCQQAVLEGAADLFCSVACEAAYALRAGGSALRRSLFRLERGRCQACRLDCHALVTRLRCTKRSLFKGSRFRIFVNSGIIRCILVQQGHRGFRFRNAAWAARHLDATFSIDAASIVSRIAEILFDDVELPPALVL